MPRALWNGATIAEADSDAVCLVEGNPYFPPECIDRTYLRESRTQTMHPAIGVACYCDVVVNGEVNHDAAWFYAAPQGEAEEIAGYFGFCRGVTVEQDA